jgi:indole-3-glycerol phosphate synthase
MYVRHAYHIYQHAYENVEHRRANQPRLCTRAFDQTAELTIIIESKRASPLDYKQTSRDQRIHGGGFWVVCYSSLYEEDGGM